ncbi:MAG TPA: hypothetical protein PLP06_10470 [Saprospiraceae bacterium]|nr:hypothetical protein [Saprospiraceae bacterium]
MSEGKKPLPSDSPQRGLRSEDFRFTELAAVFAKQKIAFNGEPFWFTFFGD